MVVHVVNGINAILGTEHHQTPTVRPPGILTAANCACGEALDVGVFSISAKEPEIESKVMLLRAALTVREKVLPAVSTYENVLFDVPLPVFPEDDSSKNPPLRGIKKCMDTLL